jgi:general secretion pathway protein J
MEVLLAIFIFSIIITSIFASYNATFHTINISESQAAVYGKARIAMTRIVEDIQSSYYSEEVTDRETFVGEEGNIEGMRADRLHFISSSHLIFNDEEKEEGKAVIIYEVREGEPGKGLLLYRHDMPARTADFEEGKGGLILCDDLELVQFTYYDAEGNEQSSWDAGSPDFDGRQARERIPRMVTVVLRFLNENNPDAPYLFKTSTIVPISRER